MISARDKADSCRQSAADHDVQPFENAKGIGFQVPSASVAVSTIFVVVPVAASS
jgi:hypothetical protein